MMRTLFAAAATVALTATPALASTLTIGSGNDSTPLAGNNDFAGDLSGLGLTILRTDATLTLDGPAKITFEYFGSESGYTDFFSSGSVVLFPENNKSTFGPTAMGSAIFLDPTTFFAEFTSTGHGMTHAPGSENFGFFLPTGTGGGSYTSNVIWIGYDDQINNRDDNHDDFIIRATVSAVPEPATWAMMIGGLGLVGAAMRRRTGRRVVTA